MGFMKFFTDKYASGSASVGVDDPLPSEEQGAIGFEANPLGAVYGNADGQIGVSQVEPTAMRIGRLGGLITSNSSGANEVVLTANTLISITSVAVTAGKTGYLWSVDVCLSADLIATEDYVQILANSALVWQGFLRAGNNHFQFDGLHKIAAGQIFIVKGFDKADGSLGRAIIKHIEV